MKGQKLLTMLLALLLAGFMANCDGGNGEEDGDAEEDVQIDDVRVDEVRPDDVPVEDVQPEEIAPDDVPTEDVVTDDVVVDDVPAEEVLPPWCTPTAIACGDSLTDLDTTGIDNNMEGYVCGGRPIDWVESGGEIFYTLTTATAQYVTVEAVAGTDTSVDVFILSAACDTDSCLLAGAYSSGTSTAGFMSEAGATYYISIDTYREMEGTFDLSVTCSTEHEICDNDADDNGDTYVDCDDPQCTYVAPCYEADCANTADDDGDTLVDCADGDCFGAMACRGGDGAVGEPCVSNSDCESGQCWNEADNGWPAGYCLILDMDKECDTELVCPTGTTCLALYYGYPPSGCFTDCTTADCRDAYICDDTWDNTCMPGCTLDTQCAVTGYCDTASGYCTPPPEICTGGVDEDGDTLVDCDDPDCSTALNCYESDCDDTIDNDSDTLVDCADPECATATNCYESSCIDTVDNDGDTLVDCADSDCAIDPACITPTALAGGDTCATAAALTMPSGERGVTAVSGTLDAPSVDDYTPSCRSADYDSLDVVYSFTLTAAANVIVDLRGVTLSDTIVFVKQDCTLATDLGCNDDFGGEWDHSRVTLTSLAAGTYYIIVDAYDGDVGTYTLAVLFSNPT